MNTQVFKLLVASCLLILPLAGNTQDANVTPADPDAQAAPISEQRNCVHLADMLEEGASAEAVVRASAATGMTLEDATVYAMVCGGDSNSVAIAVAGVRLANSLAQAQAVANAVLVTAGRHGDVADAVNEAVLLVARDLPQPAIYVDEYTPTGSDVSPAS